MSLYFLNGVDDEIGRRKNKSGGSKAEKKAARKAKHKGKGKFKHRIAKVALAPSRVAFIGLVRINMLGLAKKLARGYKRNPEAIKNFWNKFGGEWDKLAKVISKGSHEQISGIGEIGSATAAAAAVAAATPIVVALIPILKKLGVHKEGEGEGGEAPLEDLVEKGKELLANDDDVEKGDVKAPAGFESGIVKDKSDATDAEKDKADVDDGGTKAGASGIMFLFLVSELPISVAIPSLIIGAYWYLTKIKNVNVNGWLNDLRNKFAGQ